MSLFPPLFFFTFLYYTDMAAVCLVLLMLAFHLSDRNMYAAFAGNNLKSYGEYFS